MITNYMMKMLKRYLFFLYLPLFYWIFSCERETFITDATAGLTFSVDTVYFDTVFTQLGTVTKGFTVHNKHREYIRISSIKLAGGENSIFRMNIDGVPGAEQSDIEIPPKDSIYVFVEATLDPNYADDILLQEDSIMFLTNRNIQHVNLVAWGQDVHFLNKSVLETQTWVNDKPYLIFNYVYIDSLEVLTIEPGVRVYLHRDAVFFVGGTISVTGTLEDPVIFRGDRLEKMYEDIPGQWGGIYLMPGSRDNVFRHAVIRGGNFGILADTFMNTEVPTLILENSFIANQSSFGLLARGSIVKASNTVFANCANSAIALIYGGDYEFYHCTVANRWLYGGIRNYPAVLLNNYYYSSGGNIEIRNINRAYFGNCIIHGNRQFEFEIDKNPEGDGYINYTLDHCLGKFNSPTISSDHINPEIFINVLFDKDPKFISWDEYNFEPDTLSPVKDMGSRSIAELFPLDFNGSSRLDDEGPDIGAYERREGDDKRKWLYSK